MDILAIGPAHSILGALQVLVLGLGASVFVGSELKSRFGLAEVNVRSLCVRILYRSWPETLALLAVCSSAALLRFVIHPDIGVDMSDPTEMQAWTRVKQEWPILLGPETLLSLQGMLKLLVWAVVALRISVCWMFKSKFFRSSEGLEFAPLEGCAAVLSMGAAAARVSVYKNAQHFRDYNLAGPLGGVVPVVVEAVAVLLLTAIAVKLTRSTSISGAAIFVGLASWISSSNYFNFSAHKAGGDDTYDKLFILAHSLDLLASAAFCSNTVRKTLRDSNCEEAKKRGRSSWDGFVHLMMSCQQALAAYFWLVAIKPLPQFVAAGRPWCFVIIGSLIQLAAYMCAFAFYLAECLIKSPVRQVDGESPVQQAGGESQVEQDGVVPAQ